MRNTLTGAHYNICLSILSISTITNSWKLIQDTCHMIQSLQTMSATRWPAESHSTADDCCLTFQPCCRKKVDYLSYWGCLSGKPITYFPSLHLSPTQLPTSLQLTAAFIQPFWHIAWTSFLHFLLGCVLQRSCFKKTASSIWLQNWCSLRCYGLGFFDGTSHHSHFNRNFLFLLITAGDPQGSLTEAKTCSDRRNPHREHVYLCYSGLSWRYKNYALF